MELTAIKTQLKKLIVVECDKEDDMTWEDITDDEPLFGNDSKVGLDSLDALQLALVLKEHFGIKVEGSKESRKHLQSINSIVAHIQKVGSVN
ncbi:phosphopantetheine-binding protein [uncultured Paraglaciecola sp.]|uniref:phosphopantetheine-binding protein n=1 Tax=uncultured Paraglaciecola sp. TaxID=1765024 RepID=UPI0026063831|nr:phosphopantetheine-binding protein [uncultured Paraglaciecola sp.]